MARKPITKTLRKEIAAALETNQMGLYWSLIEDVLLQQVWDTPEEFAVLLKDLMDGPTK